MRESRCMSLLLRTTLHSDSEHYSPLSRLWPSVSSVILDSFLSSLRPLCSHRGPLSLYGPLSSHNPLTPLWPSVFSTAFYPHSPLFPNISISVTPTWTHGQGHKHRHGLEHGHGPGHGREHGHDIHVQRSRGLRRLCHYNAKRRFIRNQQN
jgi:hypothetical protein